MKYVIKILILVLIILVMQLMMPLLLHQIFPNINYLTHIGTMGQPLPTDIFHIQILLLQLLVPCSFLIPISTQTMRDLTFVDHIPGRSQIVVQLLQPQLMHVIDSQHLKYHFMETGDRYLEVEWLVDIAIHLIQVNKLAFVQTFIYPPVTHRLWFYLLAQVSLQLLGQFVDLTGVFENVEKVTLVDVGSARIHLSSIF